MVKFSEKEKQAAAALLIIIAVGVVAYVFFFAEPADQPSDIDGFYATVANSSRVSLFFDARGVNKEDTRIIYQCGVDLVSGKLFGTKTVTTYACDNDGCISANTGSNGTATMTYEQVRKALPSSPYVQIGWGKPATSFYLRHMELTVDRNFTGSCRFG